MTRERKKTIWDQLPNAVSGMRSPLSSAQQARSKMLWGRLRTGLPLRTAEQSRRLQLMKRLHKRFAKGRLELPVEQRRRDAVQQRAPQQTEHERVELGGAGAQLRETAGLPRAEALARAQEGLERGGVGRAHDARELLARAHVGWRPGPLCAAALALH